MPAPWWRPRTTPSARLASAVTVANGAALGFTNNVNYTTPQAVSINGSGPAGNGAIENISGTNSFAGPITLNLGGDATVGAVSGTALTLAGNINLFGQSLTVTGAGNTTISGAIAGTGSNTINNVLTGLYYSNVPGGMDTPVLDPTNARWLGNDTPTVLAPLSVPINLPNIDANSFSAAGVNIGGQNVGALWTGQITIPASAGGGGITLMPHHVLHGQRRRQSHLHRRHQPRQPGHAGRGQRL